MKKIIYATLSTLSILLLMTSLSFGKAITMKEAEDLYQETCSVCHGDKGDADTHTADAINPRPRNFTTKESRAELSHDRMIHSVTHGRPGTAMQPFKGQLSSDEIQAIVKYIRTNLMKLKENSSLPDFKGFLKALTYLDLTEKAYAADASSLKKGEVLYQENCSVCHGDKGNGKSWVARDIKPAPKNFTDPAVIKVLSKERMFRSISEGRSGTAMQPFKTQLSKEEINLVIDYIRFAFMNVKAESGTEKKKV